MKPKIKNIHLISLLLIITLLTNCNSNYSVDEDKNKATGELILVSSLRKVDGTCKNYGQFWARSLGKEQKSYCIDASLVSSSEHLNVFLENGLETNLDYKEITNIYETKIHPISKESLGTMSDINKDGKVDLLILDIKDNFISGGGFVAGFVDPINFQKDSSRLSLRSNEREVIYLDGVQLLELRDRENSVGNPDPFYSTLAHELQHLIRFSYSMGLDEVWIDEGTSELMSDLTGFGPQTSRLNCFRGDTSKSDSCSGGVAGVDLFNWNNSLKSYAYAYSFFKYIFSVSNFDTSQKYSFLKSTIQGTNGIRANNTSNLISLFKNSSNYHTQKLGSSNSSVFSKLLGLFLSQSVGYTNLSKVYFGNSTATSLEDIKPYYLMPAEMNPIRSPEGFGSITKYNYFQVYPSSAYRVKGSISGISGSKDLVAIVSDSDFLLYNGSIISGSYGATTTEIEELSNNSDLKVVCPYGDFLEEHKKNFNSRNFLIPHTHNTTKFTGE